MLPKLPLTIEILNVPLGATQGSQGGFYAKSDATVTAKLQDSSGLFQIVKMETDDVVDDPDVHGAKVLQLSEVVNGPGPINVSSGQALLVTVDFACPADPSAAKFQTNVDIQGFPAPRSILVEATAALGELAGFPLDSPQIFPGGKATCNFRLFSSKGHDVPIRFHYDTSSDLNFSAADQFRTIPAGGTVDLQVPISCVSQTPEGQHVLGFEIRSSDGSQLFSTVPTTAIVTRTVQVFTNLPDSFTLLRGDDVVCELRVVTSGSPAQFVASHGPLPPGLSVTPDNQFLTVDRMAFTHFDFEIARDAPLGKLAPVSILWTVREPEITGQLVFNIEVVADQAVFKLPQPLSQLSQENNPQPLVWDIGLLTISNSGSWHLAAHFKNQETLADVVFTFGVDLSFVDPAGNRFGVTVDGALSAAGNGPAAQAGLRILGYPPGGTYLRQDTFPLFQDPTFWQSVRDSSPSFHMIAGFAEPSSGNIPDPPEKPNKEDE